MNRKTRQDSICRVGRMRDDSKDGGVMMRVRFGKRFNNPGVKAPGCRRPTYAGPIA